MFPIRLMLPILTILMVFFAEPAMGAGKLFVEVRSTSVRKEPKHWAPAVAQVSYGEALEEISTSSGWALIKLGNGTQGYVHLSALTPRTILLSGAKAPAVEADASSIVLAGKGFNKDIEKQYFGRENSLNYSAVDSMEQRVVASSELYKFLTEGKLSLEGVS
ncbi:MAG: SH3 domain-containing protein [Oligoflexia bacterium]|nr:SH3 domain-containing protein [Oligoflexia bacterium]